MGAESLVRILRCTTFYYFTPTWENHHKVLVYAGFTEPRTFRYWDQERRGINFEDMIEDRETFEGAIIILARLRSILPASTGTVEGNCQQGHVERGF